MKQILIGLAILSMAVGTRAQNDSAEAFKYIGNGKWMTTTEWVMEYDKLLTNLNYQDSVIKVQQQELENLQSQADSWQQSFQLAEQQQEALQEKLRIREQEIIFLTQPKKITAAATEEPFLTVGFYPGLGTYYEFQDTVISKTVFLRSLKYFGSLTGSFEMLKRIRMDATIFIPAKIQLQISFKL